MQVAVVFALNGVAQFGLSQPEEVRRVCGHYGKKTRGWRTMLRSRIKALGRLGWKRGLGGGRRCVRVKVQRCMRYTMKGSKRMVPLLEMWADLLTIVHGAAAKRSVRDSAG